MKQRQNHSIAPGAGILNVSVPVIILVLSLMTLVSISLKVSAAETLRHYKIPSQPLNSALIQFAAEANLELAVTIDKVKGLTSNGIDGNMTVEQALTRLLQGSGMTYRFINTHTITLEKAPEPVKSSGPTVLKTVKVSADSIRDVKDPYNQDYVLPNATSGTMTDTPIMQTPLNVQVISKQVLNDQQVINLNDALKNVSGITTSTDPYVNGNNIFLRGFATTTTYRNGFRLDGNDFGNFQQFANVESVEVLKGPAAILYGRVEPGGMVNIITKQPLATPYYALNQQFGSYDLYRTSIDATGPLSKDDTLLYRFNISFQKNNTFRDLIQGEDLFLAPTLKWNISSRTSATLEFEYNRALSNLDQQILPANANNQPIDSVSHTLNYNESNNMRTEQTFAGLTFLHQFNDDWTLKHMINFKRQDYNFGSVIVEPYNITGNLISRYAQSPQTDVTNTISTGLNLTGHFKTGLFAHTLLVGGDYYRFDSTNNATSEGFTVSNILLNNPIHGGSIDTGPQGPNPAYHIYLKSDNYGLYAQDQIKLPYNFHVMGGLRYQYVHHIGEQGPYGAYVPYPALTDAAVTPRVGLLWEARDWLSLYGNYVENFGNNGGALTYVSPGVVKPIQPESAQQWEFGAKTQFFDGRLRTSFAYYDLTKENVAVTDTSHPAPACGYGCSVGVGAINSHGPEIDIQGEILPGWNVIATYTNQSVMITKSPETPLTNNSFLQGQRLQFTPRNIASFWNTYEVKQGDFKGFKVGGGVTLQDSQLDATNTINSSGYGLVSLMSGYSFKAGKAKVNLQLNVQNLLDKSYFTNAVSYYYPNSGFSYVSFGTPRTFMGSINVQY